MSAKEFLSDKSYISIPEYARQLGISRIAVYKKVKQGLIPAKKVGRNYVIPTDATRPAQQKSIQQQHISIPELARQLGITRIAAYQRVKSGKIKAEKIGRNYVVPIEQLSEDVLATTPKTSIQIKEVMTIPELAKQLGISRIAVYQQVKCGKIKAHKVGRNYAIEPQELTGHSPVLSSSTSLTQDFIPLPECARQLGMSRFALYQKIKKGEIVAQRIGRNLMIHQKEQDRYKSDKDK